MYQARYQETRDKIAKRIFMYETELKDVPEIAEFFNVTERTVYRYLKLSGVKLRTRSRDNRGRFLPIDN